MCVCVCVCVCVGGGGGGGISVLSSLGYTKLKRKVVRYKAFAEK